MTVIPFFATFFEGLIFIGGLGVLARSCISESLRGSIEWNLFFDQVYQVGTRSMLLIVITGLSSGAVMTMEFGFGLARFGGTPYVPKIVSLSILREMGPMFTSLMIAARVGAGIASEVGSMVVTQQVDAMRALGTSPIRKIVVPRILATALTLPILTTFANIFGILGALLIGRFELRLDAHYFFEKAVRSIHNVDYYSGVGKTFVFAFIISLVSCYYGLNVKEGTKEVGIATTRAVVTSSILVLSGDFFLTKLVWLFEQWT